MPTDIQKVLTRKVRRYNEAGVTIPTEYLELCKTHGVDPSPPAEAPAKKTAAKKKPAKKK